MTEQDDRERARERTHEGSGHAAGGLPVARVERGLTAAHLFRRYLDPEPGLSQERLGIGDDVREDQVAEAGCEELDARRAHELERMWCTGREPRRP